MVKYVFVTGGVVSGLGKGITASSLAMLLKARGYKVFMQKFDPYINVDPGMMSPYQHGEVFVTADGTETDLDLGHYERFIDEELNYTSNITTGKVYSAVINKERNGEYGGATVQVIPHITDEIKSKIFAAGKTSGANIVITEIGGTIGDIESLPFLEAIRQVRNDLGKENVVFIHVTLIPYLFGSGELKTKPTQHSVSTLRSFGIQPDILVCRTSKRLDDNLISKLAIYCSVGKDSVIQALDLENLYHIPLNFYEQKLDAAVCAHLKLLPRRINLSNWRNLIKITESLNKEVEIAIVGKYVSLHDAYLSIVESLKHAGYKYKTKIKINWIAAEKLEKKVDLNKLFKTVNGIIVPSGFGSRGIAGKIKVIKYARENNVPFLGICLGMQLACIEFARSVCGLKGANSVEFDEFTAEPVIDLITELKGYNTNNKVLRLGNYPCVIKKQTKAHEIYKTNQILERHRHCYEFNLKYLSLFEEHGFVFAGRGQHNKTVEIIEIPHLDYFVACQFHPEFKSRPTKPHPLFVAFIEKAISYQEQNN